MKKIRITDINGIYPWAKNGNLFYIRQVYFIELKYDGRIKFMRNDNDKPLFKNLDFTKNVRVNTKIHILCKTLNILLKDNKYLNRMRNV